MYEIIKNMFRRKLRTSLTVFGIAIGILALVVMGAIAEKLSLLVDGGVRYYSDKVQVSSAEGSLISTVPLKLAKGEELERVEGVRCVAATVGTTLSKDLAAVNFGPPPMIIGQQPQCDDLESYEVNFTEGQEFAPEDRGKVIVGSDLVKKLDAKVGEEVTIRDKKYEVTGILEKTFTAPDTSVMMPFADAQQIIHSNLPEIVRTQLRATDITDGFVVYPEPGVDPDELAKKIEAEVAGVKGLGPKAFEEQIASTVRTFTSIIYGIAVISLLVGTLSIINTMTMSISERTKEIGIKKAIGAKPRQILLEYLAEAGIIGFVGGAIGLGIGSLVVYLVNSVMEQTGDKVFLLSPRLLWGSLIFSVVLGIVAGIYPAVHAVRINIVKSLREE